MLFLFPGFGLLDTLEIPQDSPMLDEYNESSYTDENGWYHRHVTEVITFNYDPSAEDGADEETKVIDASKDAATDLVSDSTPSVLPLNVEKRAFR